MFNKLNISNDEKSKSMEFVQWALNEKKDLFKMAFDKEYMRICVDEYKGGNVYEN